MKVITENDNKRSLRAVSVGEAVRFADFVNAYECTIGDETRVGAFVEIQKGVVIGRRCKISSHSFICEGVHLEDEVFIGHGVVFTNDLFPRATNADGSVKSAEDWQLKETRVKHGASVGSNATILCGVVIGERAMVGAGSVVTKDVAPGTVVAGNPARFIKKI